MTQIIREFNGDFVEGVAIGAFQALPDPANGPKLQIIVADDQLLHRKFLSLLIEKSGHIAIPAVNGVEALDKIRTTDASILISDFNMPGMDGIELTRHVRELVMDRYMHVILVTGDETEPLRKSAIEAGVDDFIAKGSDPLLIQARIRASSRIVRHEQEALKNTQIIRKAHKKIKDDLKAAADAQLRLLPKAHLDVGNLQVASAFQASEIVSGDMFNVFELEDGKIGLYAIDVSGHGVRASLLSVAIWHLLTPEFFATKCTTQNGKVSPAALVSYLDDYFRDDGSDQYFTMFCAVIDAEHDEMTFCQAGYPSPILMTNGSPAVSLGEGGYPVGLFNNAVFEDQAQPFTSGDRVLLFSDGAQETCNPDGIQFGEEQMLLHLEHHRSQKLETLPTELCAALQNWRGGRSLEDDLTLVSFERKR